jgi:hypothetical protein
MEKISAQKTLKLNFILSLYCQNSEWQILVGKQNFAHLKLKENEKQTSRFKQKSEKCYQSIWD